MEPQSHNIALLVMDMQKGILVNYPDAKSLIDKVKEAIAFARNKKIPVLFVRVGFRQGAPEINLNNKAFATGKERYMNTGMEEFMTIHPDLKQQENELVITKRRISAFTGSDLEVVLRSFGIQHLVLTGISTSGVVLSTTREAADKDYQITILSDGWIRKYTGC